MHSVPRLDPTTLAYLVEELRKSESLQAEKVIDLARRLHPGITAEDIRNPHDFPDLDDPDWHFADGQLTGIQTVLTLLRSLEHVAADAGESGVSAGQGTSANRGDGSEPNGLSRVPS